MLLVIDWITLDYSRKARCIMFPSLCLCSGFEISCVLYQRAVADSETLLAASSKAVETSVFNVQWEIQGRSMALKFISSGAVIGARMLLVLDEARKSKGNIS